jgi:hypothetical protein
MKRLVLLAFVFAGCGLVAYPGKPCQKHEECSGLKSGYCARAEICTKECGATSDCPDKSVCAFDVGPRHVCLPECTKDGDCPSGFQCGDGYCVMTQPLSAPAH